MVRERTKGEEGLYKEWPIVESKPERKWGDRGGGQWKGKDPVEVVGPMESWVKGVLEPAQWAERAGIEGVLVGEPGCLH